MKKIIDGKLYDTETADRLLYKQWSTQHPNVSGRDHSLDHERAVYRTKKGTLFAYEYDEEGYGRNADGATGAFVRKRSRWEVFYGGEPAAVRWAEEQDCFDSQDIYDQFADTIEEA